MLFQAEVTVLEEVFWSILIPKACVVDGNDGVERRVMWPRMCGHSSQRNKLDETHLSPAGLLLQNTEMNTAGSMGRYNVFKIV